MVKIPILSYLKTKNYLFNRVDFFYTMIDQFIISLGNFLVTVIIIRCSGLELFGKFSILWMILLYINSFQMASIISPMYSIAPQKKFFNLKYYYGGVLVQQIFFSIIVFFMMYNILITLELFQNIKFFSFSDLNLISFCFAAVALPMQNFVKRLFFSQFFFFRALVSDFISYSFLITALIYLDNVNQLNLTNIFWSYTFAFILGFMFGFYNLLLLKFRFKEFINSINQNWLISKWLILSTSTHWFSANLWFMYVGVILGPTIFGSIRACSSVAQTVNIFFQSLENIIPGKMSKILSHKGIIQMHIYFKKVVLNYFLLTFVICAFMAIFSKLILNIVYGEVISDYYYILIFFCLLNLISFFQFPLSIALRTLNNTKSIFIAYVFATLLTVTLSRFIILKFDLSGFMYGLIFIQSIIISIMFFNYLIIFKKMK